MVLKIVATQAQIEELWNAARAATDEEGNDYGEGAYDMIQALTGNGDMAEVLENLRGE